MKLTETTVDVEKEPGPWGGGDRGQKNLEHREWGEQEMVDERDCSGQSPEVSREAEEGG